jgi:hypothetical protein
MEIIYDVTHSNSEIPEEYFVGAASLPFRASETPPESPASALLRDLWETKDHSDLLITCGDTTFETHKCIVSSKLDWSCLY